MNTNRFFTSLAVIAAVTAVAPSAFALEPLWGLKPDKNTGNVTTVDAGETAEVRALVDEQGTFKAPPGWSSRFSNTKVGGGPMECALIKRPASCGVWIAKAPISSTTTATFSYTPPTGASENRTFTINVNAPPPPVQPPAPVGNWYPADRGTALEGRVTTLEKSRENVSLFFDYRFTFNMPTTTDVGHGFQLGASAIVVDAGPAARLSVGGKFGWSRTMIEIDPALRSLVTEAPEDRFSGLFTIAWTPCVQLKDGETNRDFWCFGLGAVTGLDIYSYNQRFIKSERVNGVLTDVEHVRDRTQFGWVLGPDAYTSLRITRNFGLKFGVSVPITVTPVSRTIGKEDSVGEPESGKPAVNVELNGGAIFSF